MNLPKEINRFADVPFHHFGIESAEFSWDERKPILIVRLGHYSIPGTIEISFANVAFHSVMSESNLYMYDYDEWSENAFFAEAQASQLLRHLAKYTLLESLRPDTVQLKHYRVLAQNYFIDVVAGKAPQFKFDSDS